jgi:hypothetical protein
MKKQKSLKIEWQRLMVDKETCPRCGSTEQELDKAIKKLGQLGIKVDLHKKEISPAQFKKAPTESNRILIAGKPMEYWLSARTGKSPCCSACGDNECRTVEVEDQVYETIPTELIVQAALQAVKRRAG